MADQPKRFFDLWFVQANNVVKEIPFHVVTDWIQQGRAVTDDRIKPSGTADWYVLGDVVAFQAYFPEPELQAGDMAEALGPIEMDFDWKKMTHEEDEDVDMIPLIDISLVLLIFFMMTTAVAAISRIEVPMVSNSPSIETDPGIIRIDIDLKETGERTYAIALGVLAPAPEDDNLTSETDLVGRLDERLRVVTTAPKVRIAANGKVELRYIDGILDALERRRVKQQIRDITVEVNERAK